MGVAGLIGRGVRMALPSSSGARIARGASSTGQVTRAVAITSGRGASAVPTVRGARAIGNTRANLSTLERFGGPAVLRASPTGSRGGARYAAPIRNRTSTTGRGAPSLRFVGAAGAAAGLGLGAGYMASGYRSSSQTFTFNEAPGFDYGQFFAHPEAWDFGGRVIRDSTQARPGLLFSDLSGYNAPDALRPDVAIDGEIFTNAEWLAVMGYPAWMLPPSIAPLTPGQGQKAGFNEREDYSFLIARGLSPELARINVAGAEAARVQTFEYQLSKQLAAAGQDPSLAYGAFQTDEQRGIYGGRAAPAGDQSGIRPASVNAAPIQPGSLEADRRAGTFTRTLRVGGDLLASFLPIPGASFDDEARARTQARIANSREIRAGTPSGAFLTGASFLIPATQNEAAFDAALTIGTAGAGRFLSGLKALKLTDEIDDAAKAGRQLNKSQLDDLAKIGGKTDEGFDTIKARRAARGRTALGAAGVLAGGAGSVYYGAQVWRDLAGAYSSSSTDPSGGDPAGPGPEPATGPNAGDDGPAGYGPGYGGGGTGWPGWDPEAEFPFMGGDDLTGQLALGGAIVAAALLLSDKKTKRRNTARKVGS